MKNLINKVRHHGKKVTVYLKSQPKRIVRCMFGIWAILGLVLSLHTHPIWWTNAQTPEEPEEPIQSPCNCTVWGWNICNTITRYSNVHHYTWNITYTGVEWNVFTGIWTITISSWDSTITMLDRNLWATTNDIGSTWSYWYTIQFSGNIDNFTSDIQQCPEWFHIPSYQEWQEINNMLWNDWEYLSENLLLPYLGLWSSSQSSECWAIPCFSWEQAMSVFVPVSVDCPSYSGSNTGRSLHWTTNGKYWLRCFYDENQEYHPFIINFYSWESILDTLEIWAWNDIILPILDNTWILIFSWWFIDSELTIPFEDTTTITGNLDLYAKRIEITNQVRFINWENIVASWTIVSWSTASWIKPSDPQKSGYDFSWWYESGSSEAFDFNTPIAEDLDLYAMWTEIITNQVFFIDSGTIIASWAVVSWSTASWIKPSDPQKSGYAFSWWYESGSSEAFDFTTPITGNLNLYAFWIEIITNQVFFIDSGTIIASWTVVSWSTASWIKPSDPQKSGYAFSWWYESGASTLFDFTTPITENLNLYALWIDVPPTCNVIYDITWWTNQNVTATITWCSETILWSLSYVFTGNWTYTFVFHDLVGNTWTANATVSWITDNTTYINVEWYQFSWNDLTICNPNNSRECVIMMDRNLWATTNDITKTWSYWYKYQWWNNYWFKDWCWISTWCSDYVTSWALSMYTNLVEWSGAYNNSWYYWKVFIKWGLNTYWSDYKVHNYLWWWWSDNSWSNWWYPISNPADRQWPCPDWYHVPSAWERSKVVWRWIERSNTWVRAQWYKGTVSSSKFLNWISDHSWSYAFLVDFNIPLAGVRDYYNWRLWEIWEDTYLWTSTAPGNEAAVFAYHLDWKNIVEPWNHYSSSTALPVRCFKNTSWYNSANTWNNTWKYFSIVISNTVNAWEYTDFTVKVIKNWQIYRNYAGSVFFEILDSDWNILKDYNLYSLPSNEWYDFEISDYWKKTFRNWLRINKAWTYKLLVIDLFEWNFLWSVTFVVRWNHSSANVTYNTSKFDSKYSDEMNRAYQYARYYKITTKDTIREANMYSGLTRVAMAKMLTNYAENVLGINDFDTSKNCKFKDVSNALDKQYDYWVTKACQLGIMWVNMKNNNFNPYDPVTRAQFATALSRLLFLTKDWTDKYYSTHISKLQRDKIITNTDPTLKELRWYVMLMLMRVWK